MSGLPMSRAPRAASGRWAYTLYDGAGEHPFVHALDTEQRTAVCIDLDMPLRRRRSPCAATRLDVLGARAASSGVRLVGPKTRSGPSAHALQTLVG